MERKAVSGILLSLLLMGMLTWAFNIQPSKAEPKTWYVDDYGTADFSKIQDAINAASLGDIIHVLNGTYYEHVIVNKTVSLMGENRNATIIDGNSIGIVVLITADDVSIKGFWIRNGGQYYAETVFAGISLIDSCRANITDNIITHNYVGISTELTDMDYIHYTHSNIISGNIFEDNNLDIDLWRTNNNLVKDNIIRNFKGIGGGIGIIGSYNNTIIGNMLYGTGGIGLQEAYYNYIGKNNLSNLGIGIYLNWRNHDNLIENNVITNNHWGIIVQDSWANIVRENNITNNDYGAYATYNFAGVPPPRMPSNIFYHNNFINNTQQVLIGYVPIDVWDDGYPSGGNYWSDYSLRSPTVRDEYQGANQDILGSDGIWDSPYVIDSNNRDNYPLVKPWSPKPPSPKDDINELIQTVESWNLHKGIKTSLTSKLEGAYRSLDRENRNAAIGQLTAFRNEAEALRGKKLTTLQANQLTSEAQRIIDLIEEQTP